MRVELIITLWLLEWEKCIENVWKSFYQNNIWTCKIRSFLIKYSVIDDVSSNTFFFQTLIEWSKCNSLVLYYLSLELFRIKYVFVSLSLN